MSSTHIKTGLSDYLFLFLFFSNFSVKLLQVGLFLSTGSGQDSTLLETLYYFPSIVIWDFLISTTTCILIYAHRIIVNNIINPNQHNQHNPNQHNPNPIVLPKSHHDQLPTSTVDVSLYGYVLPTSTVSRPYGYVADYKGSTVSRPYGCVADYKGTLSIIFKTIGIMMATATVLLNCFVLAFYKLSHKLPDFQLASHVAGNLSNWWGILSTALTYFGIAITIHLIALILLKYFNPFEFQYLSTLANRLASLKYTRWIATTRRKRFILRIILCSLYLSSLYFRPRPWKQLSKPMLVKAFNGIMGISNNPSTTSRKSGITKKFDKFKLEDLDFLKYDPSTSPIKNIVVIGLESTRSDMAPFNYSSPFAKKYLSKKARKEQDVTPFLSKISKDSLYVPNGRTVVGYTQKSIFASHCGIPPYPQNFGVEYKYELPVKCLPELFKDVGYATMYMQAPKMKFDHHDENALHLGFSGWLGKETLDSRNITYEKLNCTLHKSRVHINTNRFRTC